MLIKDPSRGNVFKKTRLINDLQAVDPEKIKIGNHLNTAQQVTLYFRRLATASYTLISGQRWKNAADYVDDALKTVTIRGQDISPFAPFRRQISAFQTVTIGQALVLSVLAVAFVLGLVVYGMAMVAGALAVLIALYLGDLFLMFLLSVQTLSKPAEESIKDQVVYALTDAEWPSYTILCPLYKEVEVVPQFVKAMLDLDYPTSKLQILFLTEADDAETRMALINMHLPAHFVIVTVPAGEPRTKPRACNFGLLQATGDYIVIYDAEDIPDPLQLKKAVLTFIKGGSDLACVQAKLNFYNERQNILTRWFTAEYSLWFDLTLPGLQRAGLPLPLGGTSNHFRAETLRMLGAWDPFNVTEDCDLGLRLAHHNLRTSVLDSTTYEEANSQVKNWLRQRSRWIKGYMQTYLVYMRRPWEYFRGGRLREFLALQLVIGGKTGVLFVNPLMWLLVLLYFCFRPFVGETYHTLFPLPVLYMGTLCLVFGNFFYIYSHLMGCMKRRQYDLIKWTLLIPIYWAMTSVAGFMALYQLIFKPHYWEKTKHGLHLSQTAAPSITALNVLHSAPLAVQAAVPYSSSTGGSMTGRSANSIAAPGAARTVVHTTAPAMPVAPIEKRLTGLVAAPERRSWWRVLRSDPWLLATIGTSMLAGLLALWYFLQHHETTLYGDALSHMLIARRLFDNLTPGLAQLGGVWVPLPHLLMVPFIWNDYLWHTGLAGSLTSFPCYVVASVYIYLSARRLTKHGPASFIGTLLFIVNPNVLYLQTTPMTEPVLIATLTMACYHFLVWAQDGHPIQLILSAAATFLATLSRFDGWALCLALLVFIVVIGKIKRQRWS
ncbi:MAG TPA: glycosyltransferase, partial [Ktedonobacteraceae bacterium]|nr:glycosyltransferase [Ktedonobacteraceae bacterium]